jgi:putative flippase GtrA
LTAHPLPLAGLPRAQFVRFCAVGVTNTIVTLGAFWLLQRAGVFYLVASGLAFLAGVANSFVLNGRWTFRARGSFPRYLAVQLLGLAIGVAILTVAVTAGSSHLAGQIVAIPPVSVTTFGLARRLAFPS